MLTATRRALLLSAPFAAALSSLRAQQPLQTNQRQILELPFRSTKKYGDPFNDVEVDVIFSGPAGDLRVPAFWAGDHTWRVRFAPPEPGAYTFRSVCTDAANTSLHAVTGSLQAAPYAGRNPLLRHGPLKVSSNRRYLEHADGSPFFWLGDTWWMGLTRRLRWPHDFQRLTLDREQKGFSVIQIVAGLFPDMDAFDPRGENEAGQSWEPGFARINPAFFDWADLRIGYLVDRGLLPCILGCWGYYLPKMGAQRMQQHWRYIVARWGAYPVVWCLAGEGSMPWYLSQNPEQERAALKTGWTGIARYLRGIDPYRRLITTHPSRTARESVDDPTVLDFNMLQTGHSDRKSIPNTVRTMVAERQAEPILPVINGEVTYEGIFEASREEVQRFMFWACMLSGAAGFTYGANGIWQVNTREQPYGPSPHGRSWGNTPWDEAAALPGSRQLGHAAALLRSLPWWRMEPHPEWVEPRWTADNYELNYAAGIPGELRIVFMPMQWNPPTIVRLEPKVNYRAFLFDPSTAARHDLGRIESREGAWKTPTPPTARDWVLVMGKG
jgi:hypothetical protein